eukprot:9574671-Alexandrium_andersonii.AAC.1
MSLGTSVLHPVLLNSTCDSQCISCDASPWDWSPPRPTLCTTGPCPPCKTSCCAAIKDASVSTRGPCLLVPRWG